MAACGFSRYELRTTDVEGAKAFYRQLFGAAFWADSVAVVPLPERAAERGAPAHWLGLVTVPDVEESVGAMLALGGEALGPPQPGPDGRLRAALRDPFGAVVGVCAKAAAPNEAVPAPVAWHLLNVDDQEKAFAAYAALFGWVGTEVRDLGEAGCHQMFSWDGSGTNAGSVANTARRPGVHTHWLYHFGVADIGETTAKVTALGGRALGPWPTVSGDLVVACDDPQGAAFGLHQLAHG
jgi:predicted enzyme related to lactoylglutathione lyase